MSTVQSRCTDGLTRYFDIQPPKEYFLQLRKTGSLALPQGAHALGICPGYIARTSLDLIEER